MNPVDGPQPPGELRVGKVPGGVSPRLAALGAVVVLVTVIAIGVGGREPQATPAPSGPRSSTAVAAQASPSTTTAPQPSPLPSAPLLATPAPTHLYPLPPMPPLFVHWSPPDELYQVVARADGQLVKTFVLPGNEPTLEGALSLRGTQHASIEITLSAVGEPADKATPTRINSWRVTLRPGGLTQAPLEMLHMETLPRSTDANDPYLERSGYTFVVSARRLGSFLALYFFIAVTYPDGTGVERHWVTGDDGLIGNPART